MTTKTCVLEGITQPPVLNVPTYTWQWTIDGISIFEYDHVTPDRCYRSVSGGPITVYSDIVKNISVLGLYANPLNYEFRNFAVPKVVIN